MPPRKRTPIVVGTLVACALSAAIGPSAAHADVFKDTLVQAPSIGQPQRGSLAGSLSNLSYGPAQLARGAFQLPLPVEVPGGRGPLQASVFPSYSAENGISEWGLGWDTEHALSIVRHRLLGDLQYNDTDGFSSPWGRLVKGQDGAYYPAGMHSTVRLLQTEAGWTATLPDGTVLTYGGADVVQGQGGVYAWMLSRVDSPLGDRTLLTWTHNDSGRALLDQVSWGGRGTGTEYLAKLLYEPLDKPLASYASGIEHLVSERVARIVVSVASGGGLAERWHYQLGYTASLFGPAFYLTSLTRHFASGATDPAVVYDYDQGAEHLAQATLVHEPALDAFLADKGGIAIQPDQSSITDIEQDGLIDFEHHQAFQLVRRTEAGFERVDLTPNGSANPLCRASVSSANRPRVLARMSGLVSSPQVVVVQGNGTRSIITLCDRLGTTLSTSNVLGDWRLGATTRLVDLNRDQRPDLVTMWNGNLKILWNTTVGSTWTFMPGTVQRVGPTGVNTLWALDMNGDGMVDLVGRTADNRQITVWYGKGQGSFESQGQPMELRAASGLQVIDLNAFQFTHADLNGDGLSDIILSRNREVGVYMNQGDNFVQRIVPGISSIPFNFGYPIVADLTASGDPQVAFVDGTEAKTIALATASTGLLRRVDDGKGTVVGFTYSRVKPVPGIIHRYSLLAGVTIDSVGLGSLAYTYEYGAPVWHSVSRVLVGFGQTKRRQTSLGEVEEVDFYNDDDVSGLLVDEHDTDPAAPTLERFTHNEFAPASFAGVPFRRQTSAENGFRSPGTGSQPLSTRIDFLSYERGLCPVQSVTSKPGGTLTKTQTLAAPSLLPTALHCLAATVTLSGAHPDHDLDFHHELSIERNEYGQVTRLTETAGQAPLVLQENTYGPDHHLSTQGAPGRGQSEFAYDGKGRIVSVTAADGTVMRVSGIDPLTDALTAIVTDRGTGGTFTSSYAYDPMERLWRTWNDANGSSSTRPSSELSYRYPGGGMPGLVTTSELTDAASGATRQNAELVAADDSSLGRASWAGAWVTLGLSMLDRGTRHRVAALHPPLADLFAASTAELFGADASPQGTSDSTLFGFQRASSALRQTGVAGSKVTTLERRGAEIVERTVENGSFVREVGKDAGGLVVRRRDENGVEYRFVYDALDRLVGVITPDGSRHRLYLDAHGRPARLVRDGIAAIEYGYDPTSGRLVDKRFLDSTGTLERETTTSYDSIGRPVLVSHRKADGTTSEEHLSYDGVGASDSGGTLSGQVGFLSRVLAPLYERREQHDAAGRVNRVILRVGNGWRELAASTTFRADGSIASIATTVKDAAGTLLQTTTLSTTLDGYGRLASGQLNGRTLYSLAYDDEGRTGSITLADGHVVTFVYDDTTHRRRGYRMLGAQQDAGASWSYDARGLIASETLRAQGVDSRRDYGYDARGALTSSAGGDVASYSYSASGLPTTASDLTGTRTIARSGATIAPESGYATDAFGRIVRRGALTLTYGPTGMLTGAQNGARSLTYAYDEQGNRVLKLVGGAPERAWLLGGVLTAASFVQPIEVAGVLVGVVDGNVFKPLVTDARGSLVSDDSGAAALATAFGVRASRPAVTQVVDYTKLGYDPDLGTVRMGLRDYDPALGQFWSPDPLFLENLEKCRDDSSQCNLFAYASGNPLAFTDPTGTEDKKGEVTFFWPKDENHPGPHFGVTLFTDEDGMPGLRINAGLFSGKIDANGSEAKLLSAELSLGATPDGEGGHTFGYNGEANVSHITMKIPTGADDPETGHRASMVQVEMGVLEVAVKTTCDKDGLDWGGGGQVIGGNLLFTQHDPTSKTDAQLGIGASFGIPGKSTATPDDDAPGIGGLKWGDADKDGVREVGISANLRVLNATLTGEGPVGLYESAVAAVRDFFGW